MFKKIEWIGLGLLTLSTAAWAQYAPFNNENPEYLPYQSPTYGGGAPAYYDPYRRPGMYPDNRYNGYRYDPHLRPAERSTRTFR